MWRLVRTSFGQRRKTMRADRSAPWRPPADLEAAGIDAAERPERLPSGGVRAPGRRGLVPSAGRHGVIELVAPAKLTVSLRVAGVRDDGMHLIDAEMVSLDLHDRLRSTTRPTATGCEAVGPAAPRSGRATTISSRGVAPGRTRRVGDGRQADPRRRRPRAAGRPTRPRSCDGPASPIRRRRRSSAPTSRSASSVAGRVRGIGEVVEPLPDDRRRSRC